MAEAAEAAEPKLSIKQMKESIRAAGLPTADLLRSVSKTNTASTIFAISRE